ncbi:ring finger protein [Grosmannia clavigera kw1407]|uniref:Ring finger protein n=1 Tax=Grosmannia clavigera (strain kw1407 / UAMH 11150) TaxID=655863 RepID=F0X8G9_GROCL|nr:ring finger protein [Grosmannia clavigera kw1407]EFX06015.1 ring finger protein [Grosmannia clavigera kw1407]
MRTLEDEIRSASTSTVLTLFPDICPDYLKEKSEELAYDHESIVGHILDQVEKGFPYPKRAGLKRKRQSSSSGHSLDEEHQKKIQEDEAVLKFNSDDRRQLKKPAEYVQISKTLIQQMFVFVPQKDIATILGTHGNCLFPAILELEATMAETSPEALPFKLKKTKTKKLPEYSPESLDGTILVTRSAPKKDALEEYRAAVAICQQREEKRKQRKQLDLEEERNFQNAQTEGTIKDCECCYGEFALNRMIHCDGTLFHWFCRGCSRRMAENQIGLSKYSLACMSTDGCKSGFSRDQQKLFLDEKTRIALERIEQEHILRIAGIENLETCPFCPFAAEYPPAEINKEFQCQNPTCEEVSCRLCRKATHIPKTCAEAERESGPSARLTIEEAMSAALIRSCNMCRTPFIKELGCNKMSCSRPGCSNVQCYVCHKSCDYAHFDDTTRGGKKGNCPLFESAEQRHADEVQAAEEAARKEVASKNPDIDVNLLKIRLSDRVLADEKRRREADGGRRH